MIRRFIIVCLVFCQGINSHGQFFDDFSDDDLNSNPVWEGDLQDFIVNAQEKLKLNAEESSKSQLFTQINLPDSIQWDYEALLDFSPSANNRLRIYLAVDQLNIAEANGYFLEIGENGVNDAILLYSLRDGEEELLGAGEMGAVSEEPVFVKVAATYFPGGEWSISAAYNQNAPLSEDITLIDDGYDFSGNQIFMLECNYTSSRRDKFTFDNIGIKKYEQDKLGPVILDVTLLDAQSISIQTNEKLDETSVQKKENYTITEFGGSIGNITLSDNGTEIRLALSQPLLSGINHSITIQNLQDVKGNIGQSESFEVFVVDQAETGDLVINEILFNPETGGSDFVEIFNVSDKFINLGNLAIANAEKNESKDISYELTINPGQYLCLTEDIEYLVQRYETPDTARFLEIDIPSFNNDSGNASIINTMSAQVIDSYDYDEDQHFGQLDDLNGVSLERVSPLSDEWFSASAAVKFATPGYQNSVFLNPSLGGEEPFSFEKKTFSPNQDGSDDQLVIKYKLPDNGFLVDIHIFDQYGRLVRNLVNNELFAESGFLLWDGLGEGGEELAIGIYFIVFEAYNERGNVINAKKPAILADFLD